jgi:hypothetical protein
VHLARFRLRHGPASTGGSSFRPYWHRHSNDPIGQLWPPCTASDRWRMASSLWATTLASLFGKSITAEHRDRGEFSRAARRCLGQSRSPAVAGQPTGANEALLKIGGPGTLDIKSGHSRGCRTRRRLLAGMYGPASMAASV